MARVTSISKKSTFEEAWEYMQSFRPTDDEMRSWLDGTETWRYPEPAYTEGGLTTENARYFHWHCAKGSDGVGGVKEGGDEDRAVWHRGDGKPAIVHLEGERSDVIHSERVPAQVRFSLTAKFLEHGRCRTGELPWTIELGTDGNVVSVSIADEDEDSGSGAESDRVRRSNPNHRLGGPTTVRRVREDVIELTYAVRGEVVEKIEIRRRKT